MKAIRLLLVILFVLAVNAGLVGLYRDRNMDSYLAAYLDKTAILENTPSPRIILVGGSNSAFGYRSGMISDATGMPVVNMGLQGGLGIRFLLRSIEPYIGQGDIVIVTPEYENFTLGFSGADTLLQLLIISPRDLRYISSADEVLKLVAASPAVHTLAVKNLVLEKVFHCRTCFKDEEVYTRAAFDKHGDYALNDRPFDYDPVPYVIDPNDMDSSYKDVISVLNCFGQFAKDRNASVYLAYPSTTRVIDSDTIGYLHTLDETLKTSLEFKVLASPADYQFDDEYMFNTYYHLNEKGAVLNTNHLVSTLCESIGIGCD